VFVRLCLLCLVLVAAPRAALAATLCDAVWTDPARGRAIPLRIQLPAAGTGLATIIWSPGLGATVTAGGVWARGWLAAGFAVITVQHPGSDNIAYAREPAASRPARLRRAMGGLHMIERAGDIGFLLDELARRPREGACDLTRIDQTRIGVAGHSLGAWTVQALAGQRFGGERGQIDRRPRAFIGLSGSQLEPGDPAAIFGGIGRPFLVISGTLDGTDDGDIIARRTAIWRGLPADGRKYLALFADATHMMFAGNRPATTALGRRVEADVIRLSTVFWRRWLLEEPAADAALANPGLPPADRWEHK
jgi:hypothetical protein